MTDAEAETPIIWPPGAKNWLIWKDPDARKDWWWEEKGTTEDEMVGWHHWLMDISLSNSGSWWWTGKPGLLQSTGSQRVGRDWVTELNWTELAWKQDSFPGGSVVKNLPVTGADAGSIWVRKIPCIRKWQPTPVFLPGKSPGERSLVGYRPWGYKELETTKQLKTTARNRSEFSPRTPHDPLQQIVNAVSQVYTSWYYHQYLTIVLIAESSEVSSEQGANI